MNAYAYQVEDAEKMAKMKRAILASCMGTGKSRIALMAAKKLKLHTLIICPPGLQSNWANEAAIAESLVEINPDSKMPKPPKQIDYTLIVDECHRHQSIKAKRTQAMLELAKAPNCKAVFLLTGTPMRNGRPKNLYSLLRAIGHPLGKFKGDYEKRYCGARWKAFGRVVPIVDESANTLEAVGWKCKCGKGQRTPMNWHNPMMRCCSCGELTKRPLIVYDIDGASNLDELKLAIEPVMLRRTKEECLDLPAKTRVYRDAEVTTESKAVFKAVFDECLTSFRIKVQEGKASSESESLVLLSAMRKAASTAKIETAIEMIESICEEGGRVICFCEFVDTANAIANHFQAMPFTGQTSMKDRDEIVKAFQSGEQNVFIGTTGAGGLGLNLTAANYVLMVDRPMTPGDTLQAEDRAHRIGQHNPVSVYWLRAFEIDKKIDEMLLGKMEVIGDVLGGQVSEPISAAVVLRKLFAHAKAAKMHVEAGAGI